VDPLSLPARSSNRTDEVAHNVTARDGVHWRWWRRFPQGPYERQHAPLVIPAFVLAVIVGTLLAQCHKAGTIIGPVPAATSPGSLTEMLRSRVEGRQPNPQIMRARQGMQGAAKPVFREGEWDMGVQS
jgi:hypothetical protein